MQFQPTPSNTNTMKLKTVFACLILALLTLLGTLAIPVIAQQPAPAVVTEKDNQILARVVSQEGIPTSPELQSVLNRSVELKGFGAIAFRAPLKSSSKNATPIVLFHGIFGGVSHRELRQLLSSLDKTGAPVYIMDLPGVGRSAKPKTTYNFEKIDQFISEFLTEVVRRPAHVVASGTTTLSALKVASQKPSLVKSLIILSPNGITTLASPPTEEQNQAYQQALQTDDAAIWVNLLLPASIRPFNEASFSEPSFLEKNGDILIEEALIQRPNIEQRWISYAFIFGQFFRPFAEASKSVKVPVLAIFGEDYKPIPGDPPIEIDRAEQFRQIRPDFKYLEIPQASTLVYTEQPEAVTKAIVEFSCGGNCSA
ncbi:alpha/beta fold hydrolase [Pelatocladus sp. BLCC-F211]|uniref:alpha/beta fold hydrolase n=1 Tax=Pelatocladus sp. BLCC-F211 TaxID=3342752 RepID=UPI0035B9F1D7